jgi:hypothetical protein
MQATPHEDDAEAARRASARLVDAAACALKEAVSCLSARGEREAHRRALAAAFAHAEQALEWSPNALEPRLVLVRAHAARAEDACHGANQLSMSAQRAPTREACDAGFRRVETLVAVALASAEAARSLADTIAPVARPPLARVARAAAERAEHAARSARRLLEERNDAYTFHTDDGFSFGEGWYLAAAGVLAGVPIQIEPNRSGTHAAETFLRDAGLELLVRPYRPRPRAMKHVTAIVGEAFLRDPRSAQARLRRAFLGEAPIPPSIAAFVDARLARAPRGPKVLLWIRDGAHHPGRNTARGELLHLTERAKRAGLVPMWIGDRVDGGIPDGVVDLILFWKDPLFRGATRRRAQLWFFEHLRVAHGLVGQLGVTTAGMDGPALLGLPTRYLTDAPNLRMRAWVGAVPEYVEVVREPGWLERIDEALETWAARPKEKTLVAPFEHGATAGAQRMANE